MLLSVLFVYILLSVISASDDKEKQEYCNRPWPELELMVPLKLDGNVHGRRYEFESLFLRTFLFFWPLRVSNTSLMIVLNEESKTTEKYLYDEIYNTVMGVKDRIPGGVRVVDSPQSAYYKHGSDRQQLLMFWADNYTTKEYVGFGDSDCSFLTYIDREDLFENGKPVVNGRSGYHHANDGWDQAPKFTYYTLGILEPMRCMSYFPVIIKTSHFQEIRNHISNHFNMSFNEAFLNFSQVPGIYSQFSIFCTYLFTYHRDDYTWYIHSETPTWDGINPPPRAGQDGNVSMFTKEMYLPKPRIATHVRYRTSPNTPVQEFPNISKYRNKMNMLMQRGVCMSPPFPKTESVCDGNQTFVVDGYNHEMHSFEYFDWRKVVSKEALVNEFNKRYERMKYCNHSWDPQEMSLVMKPEEKMGDGWQRSRLRKVRG